jgi:hypothetical protein
MDVPKYLKWDDSVAYDKFEAGKIRTSSKGYDSYSEANQNAGKLAAKSQTDKYYPDHTIKEFNGKYYIYWHT